MKEFFFSSDYLETMKKNNKDLFWDKEFVTYLLRNFNFSNCQAIPEGTQYLSVTDIIGPLEQGIYMMVVDTLKDNPDGSLQKTHTVSLLLNVSISISYACQLMKQNPLDRYVFHYGESKVNFHTAQQKVLFNRQITLNVNKTDENNKIIPRQKLSSSDELIWQPILRQAVEENLENTLLNEDVNGFVSSKFPPSTNKLVIKDVLPGSNYPTKGNRPVTYVLSIIPCKETQNRFEKLSAEPIYVLVSIPTRIRNSYLENYKSKKSEVDHIILPALKISDIYSAAEYRDYKKLKSGAQAVAKSMMSSILAEKITEQPDTFSSHTPLASISSIKAEVIENETPPVFSWRIY